mgnify:CR=1 FL=1
MGSVLEEHQASPGQSAVRYEPKDVPPLLPFWLGLLIAAFVGAGDVEQVRGGFIGSRGRERAQQVREKLVEIARRDRAAAAASE